MSRTKLLRNRKILKICWLYKKDCFCSIISGVVGLGSEWEIILEENRLLLELESSPIP